MGCGVSADQENDGLEQVSNTIPERKVVVIGSSGVGKTAIIHSLVENKVQAQNSYTPTTGVKN